MHNVQVCLLCKQLDERTSVDEMSSLVVGRNRVIWFRQLAAHGGAHATTGLPRPARRACSRARRDVTTAVSLIEKMPFMIINTRIGATAPIASMFHLIDRVTMFIKE